MKNRVFTSNRFFILYDYNPSHGQLLLRSQITEDHLTNIDIIFMDVEFVQMQTYYSKISIFKEINYDKRASNLPLRINSRKNLFRINEDGIIQAFSINVFENSLSYGETSLGIGDILGREKKII